MTREGHAFEYIYIVIDGEFEVSKMIVPNSKRFKNDQIESKIIRPLIDMDKRDNFSVQKVMLKKATKKAARLAIISETKLLNENDAYMESVASVTVTCRS